MLDRLLSAASALMVSACSVFCIRSGTEEPRFTVIGQQGEIEIRRYAPRLAAETVVTGMAEREARNEGFQRLAGYIFGRNRSQARIAMTAPVAQAPEKIAMTIPVGQAAAAEGWTIRFFMPAGSTRETLPEPEDARVTLTAVPAEVVAVLRYTGIPTPAAAAARRAALLAALAEGPWQPAGPALDWFYDPPWTVPTLRRNEAVVPVTPR